MDPGAREWLDRLLAHSGELLVIQSLADFRTAFVSPSVESLPGIPAHEAQRRWSEIAHVVRDRERAATLPGSLRGDHHTRPGAILLADVDGRIRFASESIRRLIGHDPAALVGRQGLTFIHPEDREQAVRDFAGLREATGQAETTLRVGRADGGHEWVGFTAVNRLGDPDLGAIVFSLRTVNEEMLSERRIERLLRDSAGASFVVTRDGEITWSTPGVERFIGTHRSLGAAVMADLVAEQDLDSAATPRRGRCPYGSCHLDVGPQVVVESPEG